VIVIARYFGVRDRADRVAILTTCISTACARSIQRTVLETLGAKSVDVLMFPSESLATTAAVKK
jgi:hypothetical protein